MVGGDERAGMSTRAQRDEEFRAFVRSSSGSLSRTAWFLTGDADVAADLVQEAYARAYASWGRVRRADALAYVRKILVNANVDRWRRVRHEVVADDVDRAADGDIADGFSAGGFETGVDERDRVARMLALLPRRQRAVVVLRYADDLSEQAVADHLGISVGAVKSAASRGLAALRVSVSTSDLEREWR